MAGFFAKLWIFAAALHGDAVGLAVVAAVNSIVALFYYVKVIKAMYLDPVPVTSPSVPRSGALRLTLSLCTLGLLAIGLMPGPWLEFTGSVLPLLLKPGDLPWL